MSPERLWLLSIALRERGHLRLAFLVKKLNAFVFHNSLPPGSSVSPDIFLGHHSLGTVIHGNVVIGRRVKIWHNVTLAVRSYSGSPHRIIIEDDVKIGANSVVITPLEESLRIGRGARIGAGAVVTGDVPAGATVVSAHARVLMNDGVAAAIDDASATEDRAAGALAPDPGA